MEKLKMKSVSFMVVLPLMAAACVQWDLGGGKIFYVTPSYTMLQVSGDDGHDSLYQIRNVDIKPLACMSTTLNATLKIDGVPEFSKNDVSALCNIPDFCFKKLKPKIYETPDSETRVISAEV